jgi:magnesium transporter
MPGDDEPDLLRVAADHATRAVPTAAPDDAAGTVRASLAERRFDSADDVAVLDGERLVGIVPIERLLAAPGSDAMAALMDAHPPTVGPGAAQEAAAWRMVRHGESSLPVVDGDGRFLGLIPPSRMLAVLLAEHDEDLARLGGYMAGAERSRRAAEEPLRPRLWHRLPWLLLGLAGAMVSAVLVGSFEDELDKKVLLAFFIPGVVYMADAVGTQTETVIIRGMAASVSLRGVLRRELLTGALIGLIVAGAFLPFALIAWGDGGMAVAVAMALFASCSVATLVAVTLPAIFQHFGRDPAFGSGPLATVIQDLLSIAIYFAIAIPLAT